MLGASHCAMNPFHRFVTILSIFNHPFPPFFTHQIPKISLCSILGEKRNQDGKKHFHTARTPRLFVADLRSAQAFFLPHRAVYKTSQGVFCARGTDSRGDRFLGQPGAVHPAHTNTGGQQYRSHYNAAAHQSGGRNFSHRHR